MHDIKELFEQLGLDESDAGIDRFIARTGPLPAALPLAEAGIWSPSRASFLREVVLEDANGSNAVDQLDARLR